MCKMNNRICVNSKNIKLNERGFVLHTVFHQIMLTPINADFSVYIRDIQLKVTKSKLSEWTLLLLLAI
jgi:hypothetical protein